MRNKATFNGERLKSARIYRGLTVAELAEKLELQRQTVSMYENNKINNPELNTIVNMSKVLNFPKKFFLENDDVDIKNGSTYFRALLTTSKKYRNQQIQKVDIITKIYRYLNEYIDFPPSNLPQENYDNPEEAAIALRKFWKLGDGPIDNIIYKAEQNGILVTMFNTDTGEIDAFSQLISIDYLNMYLIGCSKNKGTAARIHFDIAHELGHILLHEWSEDIETLSKDEFKEKEKEANAFASALLLPQNIFIKDIGAYADNLAYYIELKKKWKVSISAMIRRSYNLGLIDSNVYQQLMRTMQKKGIKKKEPLDDILYTAPPSLLRTSVQILLEQKVLTPSEFMNELSYNHNLSLESSEIETLLDLPKNILKVVNEKPIHKLNIKSLKKRTMNE